MSCEETYQAGHEKPALDDTFPLTATAGHQAELVVKIRHLKGETVLPGGFEWNPDSPEYQAVEAARFVIPSKQSLAQPKVDRKPVEGDPEHAETTVTIPFIPLTDTPGRAELTLPPLPIAIAKSSGQIGHLCTSPHVLTLEDPTANIPNATLRPAPEPRSQLEIWATARDITTALLVALPLAVLAAWAMIRLLPKLKKTPPPPPPIPPWTRALERLAALERERLLEQQRYEEYIDRVSDALREYLGGRFGFDGLESTTREVLRQLGERAPDFRFEIEVRNILQRSDLAKFARRAPDEAECKDAALETRRIIERTTPSPTLDPRVATGEVPSPGGER